MIWNQSANTTPQVADAYGTVLQQYDTEWYRIRLGYIFDPETSAIGTCVLYHVINNKTGVIEFQGAYLPSCINHINSLTEAMNTFNSNDGDLPKILFN